MKWLKRRQSKKSGYCNISEPVSDLDPARMSAIKRRHSAASHDEAGPRKITILDNSNIINNKANDETMVTETVTLDTLPSGESSRIVNTSPSTANQHFNNDHHPKTPDTFFGGKNRKRVPVKSDSMSQAPTEHHPVVEGTGFGNTAAGSNVLDGDVSQNQDNIQLPTSAKKTLSYPQNPDRNHHQQRDSDDQSNSSDLDKSFSPQIVTVNSDITEPTYELKDSNRPSSSSSRKKKHSSSSNNNNSSETWKKLRKLRRCLHDTVHSSSSSSSSKKKKHGNSSSAGGGSSPMNFLELMVDAICSYPEQKN